MNATTRCASGFFTGGGPADDVKERFFAGACCDRVQLGQRQTFLSGERNCRRPRYLIHLSSPEQIHPMQLCETITAVWSASVASHASHRHRQRRAATTAASEMCHRHFGFDLTQQAWQQACGAQQGQRRRDLVLQPIADLASCPTTTPGQIQATTQSTRTRAAPFGPQPGPEKQRPVPTPRPKSTATWCRHSTRW